MEEVRKLQEISMLNRTIFGSLISLFIGAGLFGMAIVAFKNSDNTGTVFMIASTFFVLGVVANYVTIHYLINKNNRWYYSPRVALRKRALRKRFGLS